MKIADRIHEIEESKSVGLAAIVASLRAQGREIISLNVGEPDFPTPDSIINATKKALDENKTRYSLVQGIKELRQGIAKKVTRDNNYDVTYENIILGNGSKHILYNIFQTIINPGEEVIIPSPYWVTFPESVKLAGGVPVFVSTKDLQLDLEAIERPLLKRLKLLLSILRIIQLVQFILKRICKKLLNLQKSMTSLLLLMKLMKCLPLMMSRMLRWLHLERKPLIVLLRYKAFRNHTA